MAVCSKCGAEVKDGAKFCNKCGAPMEAAPAAATPAAEAPKTEAASAPVPPVPPVQPQQVPPVQNQVPPVQNQVPPMQGQVPPMQGQVPPQYGQVPPQYGQNPYGQNPYGQVPPYGYAPQPQQPSAAKEAAKGIFAQYLAIIKAPVEAGREFVASGNKSMGFILIALQAVFTAIFAIIGQYKFYETINTGYFDVKVPYLAGFVGTLLLSYVFSMLHAAIIFVINKIVSVQTDFIAMVNATAVRSVVIIPVTIISIVLMLFKPEYALVVFFSSVIWGIIVVSNVLDMKAHKQLSLIMFAAMLIYLFVCYKIMEKTYTIYLPESMKNYMRYGFSDLFDMF